MTRKPQQTGPTAEDISRHEEEVAAYLSRYDALDAAHPRSDNVMARLKDFPTAERLIHILGRYHVQFSEPTFPDRDVLAATIISLTAMIRCQMELDART